MVMEIEHQTIASNGIHLHVAIAGPADGPLVILLHGFPEPWSCWQRQIGPLCQAGYRVLAPDLRGYNLSDKPQGIAAYALDLVASDVLGLIAAEGRSRTDLVGHDWGGIVAWWLAIQHPEQVERMVILNAPHPVAFRRELLRNPAQIARSWYAFTFQLPGLPEYLLSQGQFKRLITGLRGSSRPGAFSEDDFDEYRKAWSQPGAMTAMLHWYRAAFRRSPAFPPHARVSVPTLILWGDRDTAIGPGVADASLAFCDAGRLQRFPDATHWILHEEPAAISRLILEFLGEGSHRREPGVGEEPAVGLGREGE